MLSIGIRFTADVRDRMQVTYVFKDILFWSIIVSFQFHELFIVRVLSLTVYFLPISKKLCDKNVNVVIDVTDFFLYFHLVDCLEMLYSIL